MVFNFVNPNEPAGERIRRLPPVEVDPDPDMDAEWNRDMSASCSALSPEGRRCEKRHRGETDGEHFFFHTWDTLDGHGYTYSTREVPIYFQGDWSGRLVEFASNS